MKLRRYSFHNRTNLLSMSVIAIGAFSINVHAIAPPVGYDDWSADASGNISAVCPVSYYCGLEVNEGGFLQQRLIELTPEGGVKRNGNFFFRTIISEADYNSTSLVRAYRNMFSSPVMRNGIANKQSIGSSQTTLNAQTNFISDTAIYTGWANTLGIPGLQTNQSINEVFRKAGAGGVYLEGIFNASTNISANYDEYGARTGFSFTANQSLEEPGEYGGGTYSEIDSQVFSMRGLEGDMLTTSGSLMLNGSGLSWAEGDRLWGFAIGQNFHHSNLTGSGDTLLVGHRTRGSQDLSVMFESYDNRSDGVGAINYFAYFENEVTGWPAVFGSEPVLPAATGKSSSTGDAPGSSPTIVADLFTPTAVGSAQADGRDAPLAFGLWDVAGGLLTVDGVLSEPISITDDGVSAPVNYTVGDDGSIIPDCSPDAVCEAASIVAPGMVQRVVRDENGERYIQTILTDLDTGFSSESFVSVADTGLTSGSRNGVRYIGGTIESTRESGISLNMVLAEDRADVDAKGNLTTKVAINTGWAARTGTPNVAITQDIKDLGKYFIPFNQSFDFQGNRDVNGNSIGSLVDVGQSGIKFAAIFNNFSISTNDALEFAHRSREGNLQSDTGGFSGISWAVGDAISATWISNRFSSGQTSGFGGVFYDNLVDDLGYVDVGWRYSGYAGLGSNWVSSAFGALPE